MSRSAGLLCHGSISNSSAAANFPYRPHPKKNYHTQHPVAPLVGYRPPSTTYYRHSVYTYNRNTEKVLPATTANANKMIRAYFNMEPSERYAELLAGQVESREDPEGDQLPESTSNKSMNALAKRFQQLSEEERFERSIADEEGPWREPSVKEQLAKLHKGESEVEDVAKAMVDVRQKYERDVKRKIRLHKTKEARIYVSDRGYANKGMIRQDIQGKISQRMQPRAAFHYPFKALQEKQPQITYKHYRDGVGVSVHVYEGQPPTFIESRKQAQSTK